MDAVQRMCIFLVLASSALSACHSKHEKATVGLASSASSERVSNAQLETMLAALGARCHFEEKTGKLLQCPRRERAKISDLLTRGERTHANTFPVLVNALLGKDKKLSLAAASVLESEYSGRWADTIPADLDAALVQRLLDSVNALPVGTARRVAPAVVHAALLSNEDERLFEVLESSPRAVAKEAYPHLMRYGRLRVLPLLKRQLDASDPALAAAALDASRHLPKPSPAEMKQICDWVTPHAKDERPEVAAAALKALARCGNSGLDMAINELSERLDAGEVSDLLIHELRFCFIQDKSRASAGLLERCTRYRRLLEQITKSSQQPGLTRARAVRELSVMFRDKPTLALAKSFVESPDRNLSAEAKRAVRNLARLENAPL